MCKRDIIKTIHYICQLSHLARSIKSSGNLTEIGPFHFLLDRLIKLHKCWDGPPHLSPFLIGNKTIKYFFKLSKPYLLNSVLFVIIQWHCPIEPDQTVNPNSSTISGGWVWRDPWPFPGLFLHLSLGRIQISHHSSNQVQDGISPEKFWCVIHVLQNICCV